MTSMNTQFYWDLNHVPFTDILFSTFLGRWSFGILLYEMVTLGECFETTVYSYICTAGQIVYTVATKVDAT